MKKTISIILLVVITAGISGGGIYLWQKSIWDKEKAKLTSEINDLQKQASQMQATTQPQTAKNQNTTVGLGCPENYKEYISKNLGVNFCYPETVGDPSGSPSAIEVTEEGDKIFVYNQGTNKETEQYVEVFNKNKNDTLVQAIEKTLLQNISKDKCWTSPLLLSENPLGGITYPENYVLANPLEYPIPENSTDFSSFFANAGNCPEEYRETNGIRYFMMDQNSPDRFFFFSIGQYFISGWPPAGTGKPAWQETIKIFAKK